MCAYSPMQQQQPKMNNNNCMQENRRTGPPNIWLPPGFRFHPTDDELITFYLIKKVLNNKFVAHAIAEVDLNKYEPWDLPERANMGEKEWYFFSLRDRKYPTGMRTNRATEAGYWKATGKDRDIRGSSLSGYSNSLVGMKKTLVFYRGRAPRGEKTNWVMHEYRLEGKTAHLYGSRSSKEEWVVCRIFQKKALTTKLKLGNAFGEDAQDSDVPSSPTGVKQEYEKPLCAELDTQACTDQLSYEENWSTKGGNYGIYGGSELARLLDPEFLPALRSNHITKVHENSCLRGLTRSCKNEPHIEANTYEFQYGSSQNQHLDIPNDQALLNELLLNRFLVDPSAASVELDQLYAL